MSTMKTGKTASVTNTLISHNRQITAIVIVLLYCITVLIEPVKKIAALRSAYLCVVQSFI